MTTMTVTRIETDAGSHIEPPLDQKADDLTKLRWQAAVLHADEGIVVNVAKPSRGRGYSLSGSGFSMSPMSFDHCWTFISGVGLGARLDTREADADA